MLFCVPSLVHVLGLTKHSSKKSTQHQIYVRQGLGNMALGYPFLPSLNGLLHKCAIQWLNKPRSKEEKRDAIIKETEAAQNFGPSKGNGQANVFVNVLWSEQRENCSQDYSLCHFRASQGVQMQCMMCFEIWASIKKLMARLRDPHGRMRSASWNTHTRPAQL